MVFENDFRSINKLLSKKIDDTENLNNNNKTEGKNFTKMFVSIVGRLDYRNILL